jgi:tetratricopeptide (TPR) repeat protein
VGNQGHPAAIGRVGDNKTYFASGSSIGLSMSKRFLRAPSAPPPTADPQSLIDASRTLLAQGKVAEAFAHCQAAYGLAPGHPQVLHLLGVAYIGVGQSDIGMAYIRRAIATDPQAAEFRRNLATALATAQRWREMAEELETYCAMRPGDAQAFADLAQARMSQEHHDEARTLLERALVLSPGRADWHVALARCHYQRWNMPAAVDSVRHAIALQAGLARNLNIGYVEPTRAAAAQPSSAEALDDSPTVSSADLENACRDRDLLVIDDVLDDPLTYRAQALALCAQQAERNERLSFPGVQTTAQPCEALMQRVSDALGRALKWDSADHGALRISLAGDRARADVHVDSPTIENIFGGVLYLSLPQHCRGGTSFYRHRKSGWDRRPDASTMRAAGYESFLDFQRRNVRPNRMQPFAQWLQQRDETWERIFEVPMRFNRLVVFLSDFFHAITELFGEHAENGRLVQLLHFEAAR